MTYRPTSNMPPLDANLQHSIDLAEMRQLRALVAHWRMEVAKRDDEIAALKAELDTLRRLAVQVHGRRDA